MRADLDNEKRILIVDDDEDILTAGQLLLKRHFDEVVTCNRPEHIPRVMAERGFDAVLLDMNFSPGDSSGEQGFTWLKRILELDADAVVVMITAHGGVDIAVEAMKHGATDFIAKPWHNEKVIATLSAAVQLHQSRSEASRLKRSNQLLVETAGGGGQNLLGASAAMAAVHSMIRRAAPTDANVLILGENGTGKELVARELHQHSLRSDNVFMSVDLGSVSEHLFESELFGHKKGAFTGAGGDRIGRLVAADGGTLFLDEIGNIPPHLQAKLLTVLEQRQVTPLGSNQASAIDVRVIAATNIAKEALSDDKRFRQDLLFRLNTVEITLPPLRQRVEDIAEIAAYYAQLYSRKYRKAEKPFSERALAAARAYHWPGNVRALRHAVERAVILSEGAMFEALDLQIPPGHEEISRHEGGSEPAATGAEDLHLERMEQRLVRAALQRHRYNISKAAKELGLTRAALYRRMEKYGFNHFAGLMMVRVALLTATLVGLSLALTTAGYHAITLLLAAMAAAVVFELYRHVTKTNAELTRFLSAVRYGDFGQRFRPPHAGAGFDRLSAEFTAIMQGFKASRQQQEEQLRHLKSLTEHIPVPLLSVYPQGRIQLHNNAARGLFGSVRVARVEDLDAFSDDFSAAIKNLEPGRRQLVNFSFDGMERQLAAMATQIVTGSTREHLISLQDIQRELDDAQLQAWQDLVRVLTHEIMNSITPVASLAKTAADLVDDARNKLHAKTSVGEVLEELEDVSRAVNTVARRSDGMMQFVQSYRSLTLLPAPQKQALLLLDLLRRVKELLAGDWAAKGIELSISVEPEHLRLTADPDLVEQMLLNLLQNAEQALNASDNPQVTITGRLHQRGSVMVEVADNGPGIPAGINNEIFVPFFTTKPQGSGVGLALTRQIMIAHGGTVAVNRSATGGARFTLSF